MSIESQREVLAT